MRTYTPSAAAADRVPRLSRTHALRGTERLSVVPRAPRGRLGGPALPGSDAVRARRPRAAQPPVLGQVVLEGPPRADPVAAHAAVRSARVLRARRELPGIPARAARVQRARAARDR